jgi:hypothetical protein
LLSAATCSAFSVRALCAKSPEEAAIRNNELREKLRPLWPQFRKQVLEKFIRENPTERPWAFWEFDLPGMRPLLSQAGTAEDRQRARERRRAQETMLLYNGGFLSEAEAKLVDARQKEQEALNELPDVEED